jgi:hypothetical protein
VWSADLSFDKPRVCGRGAGYLLWKYSVPLIPYEAAGPCLSVPCGLISVCFKVAYGDREGEDV